MNTHGPNQRLRLLATATICLAAIAGASVLERHATEDSSDTRTLAMTPSSVIQLRQLNSLRRPVEACPIVAAAPQCSIESR